MKNIFVLPTSQASRLYLGNNRNFVFGMMQTSIQSRNDDFTNQNIYITNDDKFVKDEYITDGIEVIQASSKLVNAQGLVNRRNWRKIILTTDQDLIKDGVQAIDDEFLEWFVQNPSCEFVEVIYEPKNFLDTKQGWEYEIIIPKKNFYCGDKFDYDEQCEFQCDTCVDKKGVDYGYLPKEEPKQVLTEEDIFNQKDIDAVTDYINKEQQKQHLIDMMKSDEELGLYDDTEINRIEVVCKDCSDSLEDCTCIKSTIDFPKQEIKLEEVFNDDKKENIKKFIDEIKNPSEPNQALIDAAERYIAGDNYNRYYDDFPKQETLEQVAERILANNIDGLKDALKDDDLFFFYKGVIQCYGEAMAKWQKEQYTIEEQHVGHTIDELDKEYIKGFNEGSAYYIERMYSEEEVIAFGEFIFKNTLLTHAKGVKNLFEQFKKK